MHGRARRRASASPSFLPRARNAIASTACPSPATARRRRWSAPTGVTSARRWRGKANTGSGLPDAVRSGRLQAVGERRASPRSPSAPRRPRGPLRRAPQRPRRRAAPRERRATRRAARSASVTPAAIACPPPLTANPASTAARTARPRSTPAIERPEPVACPPVERKREGRALEPLLEPRRDEADDARRPSLARDDDRRAALLEAERQRAPRPRPRRAPRSRSLGARGSSRSSSTAIARASRSSAVVRSRTPKAASPMRPPALMRGPMRKPR